MKLSDNMRYPHPVLSEYSQDYVKGEFLCEFAQQLTQANELKISADLQINTKELLDLVETQKAAVGYFLVCRRTYFNSLQTVPLGKSDKFFDAARLFGTVTLRPVVWTLCKVEDFSSPFFHSEFGGSTNLPKGSVIALGPEFRFSIDKKKFKPFESIFDLTENKAVEAGTISVDPTLERITISAEPKTYKNLASMRYLAGGRDLLLNSVYLPAVMEVISHLQSGGDSSKGKQWYRVFKAKCDDLGIDPSAPHESPVKLAQKLLRAPLIKTIAFVERL